MSQYNFDEKPKNDFDNYGKYKNEYSAPERGGCLSFFLAFLVFANGLIILLMLFTLSELQGVSSYYQDELSGTYLLVGVQVLMSIGVFSCVYGVWNWKKWGYTGIFIVYGISIFLNLITGGIPQAVGAAIGMGLFYYVMKDKTYYLS